MTVMGRVKLNCPHCGGAITVRVNAGEGGGVSGSPGGGGGDIGRGGGGPGPQPTPAQQAEVFRRSDEMFKSLREHFKRIGDPKLWMWKK